MNTTILIPTTSRPTLLRRLLDSIALYAPQYPVIVYDDTKTDFGVSATRNKLVREAQTKYVMLVDDDCVFTHQTRIADLEAELERQKVDIMGCGVIEHGIELGYRGKYLTYNKTVEMVSGEPLEFIPSIFLAKKKKLIKCPWDEELKIGEHFAFFYENRNKLKVGYTPTVALEHRHSGNPRYNQLRGRAIDFVKLYMRKKGIKERIDLNGEHLLA